MMQFTREQLWDRFQEYYQEYPSLGLNIDISRMNFDEHFFAGIKTKMAQAFEAMAELEAGSIANPDEKRMVGHYWLRNAGLAPTPEIKQEIEKTLASIKGFTASVHSGEVRG